MSRWDWVMFGVVGWTIGSVIFGLCFSAWIRAGNVRFVPASSQRANGARRAAAKQPVWIMPDCGCPQCVERRTAAQNARSMEHAYDRAMRDAFEKQED